MDVSIRGLSKTFFTANGSLEALRAVDLEVAPHSFTAVVGPSGSGKSTLLEIVAGLNRPSAGEVRVGGKLVTAPARDRAIVFQDYALFPWRTVVGNLRFALEAQRVPRREWEERCARYLEMVDLSSFRDAYPAQLSGGMRQRVALARALVVHPEILLLDEPFAALDAITRRKLQLLLADIVRRESKTALLVTHSIDEALILGDRVAILSSRPGRVIEVIEVPPHPIEAGGVLTPELTELKRRIWRLLEPATSVDADSEVAAPPAAVGAGRAG
jgi:NitT/TauT family transport system ATP-binding protein